LEGTYEVLTALGLPRRGTDTLGRLAESRTLATLPRKAHSAVVNAVTAMGTQRLRIAALPTWPGTRVRARAAAAIAGQAGHYRSWGLDLGVQYRHGFLSGEPEFDADDSVQTYVPAIAVGARLPHAWIVSANGRTSTLDLIVPDALTLIVDLDRSHPWITATRRSPYPVRVRAVTIPDSIYAELATNGTALLTRPDGHVAAILRGGNGQEQHSLELALTQLGLTGEE
jgi:hypothetical protein